MAQIIEGKTIFLYNLKGNKPGFWFDWETRHLGRILAL